MPGKTDIYNLGEKGVNIVRSPIHKQDGELTTAQNAQIIPYHSQRAIAKRKGMYVINVTTAAAGAVLNLFRVSLTDPDSGDVDPVPSTWPFAQMYATDVSNYIPAIEITSAGVVSTSSLDWPAYQALFNDYYPRSVSYNSTGYFIPWQMDGWNPNGFMVHASVDSLIKLTASTGSVLAAESDLPQYAAFGTGGAPIKALSYDATDGSVVALWSYDMFDPNPVVKQGFTIGEVSSAGTFSVVVEAKQSDLGYVAQQGIVCAIAKRGSTYVVIGAAGDLITYNGSFSASLGAWPWTGATGSGDVGNGPYWAGFLSDGTLGIAVWRGSPDGATVATSWGRRSSSGTWSFTDDVYEYSSAIVFNDEFWVIKEDYDDECAIYRSADGLAWTLVHDFFANGFPWGSGANGLWEYKGELWGMALANDDTCEIVRISAGGSVTVVSSGQFEGRYNFIVVRVP